MSQNLLTSGLINPFQFPVRQLLAETAAILNISPERILEIQCWQYSLWVNIQGVGGKLISYRRLPMWIVATKKAVENCTTLASLDDIAALLRTEIQRYGKYYESHDIEMLRQTWGECSKAIKAEEKRLQPIKAQQEAAHLWQQSWMNILRYCGDIHALHRLMKEIQKQSDKFLNVPGILTPIEELWAKRGQELLAETA